MHWKSHPIYDKYELNTNGEIRHKRLQRLLNCNDPDNHKGYVRVTLHHNGRQVTKNLHRLVIETFKGLNDKEVNHKDGNKLNNALSNLEYCDRVENAKHAANKSLYKKGDKVHTALISNKEVHEICRMLALGYKTKYILKNMKFPNNNKYRNIIRRIYDRSAWRAISDLYVWDSMIIPEVDNVDEISMTLKVRNKKKKTITYSEEMLTDIINRLIDGERPYIIADSYPEFNRKNLLSHILRIRARKMQVTLYDKILEERSTTIEPTMVFKVRYGLSRVGLK